MSHFDNTWTANEDDLLKYLAGCNLSAGQIADAFAIAGLSERNDNAIQRRATKLNVKFTAREAKQARSSAA